MARLEGKVAVVTGAASGIGAACARRLAEEGAAIAGIDIQDPLDGDWKEAVRVAPGAFFEKADVRDGAALCAIAERARKELGRIDVLVNSAGVAGGGLVHLLEEADWQKVLDINLNGTYLASKSVIPAMLEQGGGSIVNIASIEGLQGCFGGSAYNASKGAVVLLTKNMAIDYGREGIRVNAVCPGFIRTPLMHTVLEIDAMADMRERIENQHQLGRFGEPVEIAHAVLFLASDEASFVSGVALPVDGGYVAGHRFV